MLGANGDFTSFNLFVYCGNEPISRNDASGRLWDDLKRFFERIFGSEASTELTYTNEMEILPDPLPITVKKGITTSYTVSSIGDSSKPISVYANGDILNPIESIAGAKINAFNWCLDLSLGLSNTGVSISNRLANNETALNLRLNLSQLKLGLETKNTVYYDNMSQTSYTNISANAGFFFVAYILVTTGQYMPNPCQGNG